MTRKRSSISNSNQKPHNSNNSVINPLTHTTAQNPSKNHRATVRWLIGLLISSILSIIAIVYSNKPINLDVNVEVASTKSATTIFQNAGLSFDAGDYSTVIDLYSSEIVLDDSRTFPLVQANLGYMYDTGTYFAEDDSKALKYYYSAFQEKYYSIIPAILVHLLSSDNPDFDEIIRLIELAYEQNIHSVAEWIGANIQNSNYPINSSENIKRFCREFSKDEQLLFLSNLITYEKLASYKILDNKAANVYSENYSLIYQKPVTGGYLYFASHTVKRIGFVELLSNDIVFIKSTD